MIEILIDNQSVDIDQKTEAAINLSIADIETPSTASFGYTKTLDIPITDHNRQIFRFTEQVFSGEQFNNSIHTGEIRSNGMTVMIGTAQMNSFKDNGRAGGYYSINMIGAGLMWAKNAGRKMNELVSDQKVTYLPDDIYNNSIDGRTDFLLKFIPVDRGAFYIADTDGGFIPRTALDYRDYHPFFNIWEVLKLIFEGYTIETSISDKLSRLYMSGYMPVVEDSSDIERENTFRAETLLEAENMFLLSRTSNALSFVNIFTEFIENDNETLIEAIDGVPFSAFRPKEKLTAKFHIEGLFVTSYEGAYVDNLYFSITPSLAPRYVLALSPGLCSEAITPYDYDRPKDGGRLDEIPYNQYGQFFIYIKLTDYRYRSVVYQQRYEVYQYQQVEGDYPHDPHGEWSQIVVETVIKNGGFNYMDGDWIPFSMQRWRSGEFREYQRTVLLRTDDGENMPLTQLAPGVEFYLFKLAEVDLEDTSRWNMTFKLDFYTPNFNIKQEEVFSIACGFESSGRGLLPTGVNIYAYIDGMTIEPDFTGGMGYGDDIGIDVVGGTLTQLQVLLAVRQMFNLMFYTNPVTKQVFIEPRTTFYKDGVEVVDWSDKIDYSKDIIIEELGADMGTSLVLAYAAGGDVQKRYNRKNKTESGTYIAPLLNKIPTEPKEIRNEVWAPMVSKVIESVGFAEGVPQDAVDEERMSIGEAEMDITPIVVEYVGVADRTSGTDLGQYPKYPVVAFQDAPKGVNMGFDDMTSTEGGVQGLNQYWQDNIAMYDYGRRITCYIKLDPIDVEPIAKPNRQIRDFRGLFRLYINGEHVICRLENIGDYNPDSGASTKCEFIKD